MSCRLQNLLLRDFFVPSLDEGRYGQQLHWVDRPSGIFSIRWEHQGKKAWKEQNGSVFKDWSVRKKRWDSDDPERMSKAKQRIRSALDKLNNVRRVDGGMCDYRLYQILDIEEFDKGPKQPSEKPGLATDSECPPIQEKDPGSQKRWRCLKPRYDTSPDHAVLQEEAGDDKPCTSASPKKPNSPRKRQSSSGLADDDPDQDFHWEYYLDATQAEATPPTAFAHVERSLESGLKAGMKLEVPTPDAPGYYWLASVVTTCGPLLSLRYLGYGADRSADFWFDVSSNEVHPLGWCAQHQKPLRPPQAIQDRHLSWETLLDSELQGAVTVPSYLLELKGSAPIDQIKQGMKLLILEEENPLNGWAASVLENVGGRLLLRYDGCDTAVWDFWLFYLSHRVKALDTPSSTEQTYKPPQVIENLHGLEEWKSILKTSMDEAQKYNSKVLANILQPPVELAEHGFQVGMKLELLHPTTRKEACVATVTRVLNKHWFLVQADDMRHPKDSPPTVRCCHAQSQTIVPVGWAERNGLPLLPPPGYPEANFSWQDYLSSTGTAAAPNDIFHLEEDTLGFEEGQKLEAVNIRNLNQVCVATVEKVAPPFVWIRLESEECNFVQPLRSQQLFPVGWSASNSFPLRPPSNYSRLSKRPARRPSGLLDSPSKNKKNDSKDGKLSGMKNSKSWCPCIYLNHRCFSGPFLSKGRLAELPRQIGPGPISLVLKEVLTQVINVAYKSSRVLSELQLKGKPNPTMHQQVLKAKYKGKTYRGVVETVRNSSAVEEFCRNICMKLECCPNLFGPKCFGDNCPEKCFNLTKTKYTYNVVRKKQKKQPSGKKRARPSPAPEESSQDEQKMPGGQVEKENEQESEEESSVPAKKPKEEASSAPSRMKTRGAQLPDFKNINLDLKWQKSLKSRLVRQPQQEASQSAATQESPQCLPTAPEVRNTWCTFLRQQSREDESTYETLKIGSVPAQSMPLDSNPLEWSVSDVVRFIKTTDCSHLAKTLQEQEIDGQALLLLTLPTVQEFLELKMGPAVKFCHLIERIKLTFYTQFAK
ncbi:scm-like with four MBT domains protein 2 isoform X2 [Ornithodoros turicata]|uniref:scm-like with four MBT domains protein 2 isoform X2 n=1 Tax=Ornithodoros turicata TaxID=34597 RepID=UPI0031394C23